MTLKSQFDAADAPAPELLVGAHAVRLASDFLPRPIRFFGHTKVFRREGANVVGSNRFLGGLVDTGYFRVERGTADDGADVTRIVYDDPRNPFFMRPLTDEVRRVKENRWLGRGMFALGRRAIRAFWFTVERED